MPIVPNVICPRISRNSRCDKAEGFEEVDESCYLMLQKTVDDIIVREHNGVKSRVEFDDVYWEALNSLDKCDFDVTIYLIVTIRLSATPIL